MGFALQVSEAPQSRHVTASSRCLGAACQPWRAAATAPIAAGCAAHACACSPVLKDTRRAKKPSRSVVCAPRVSRATQAVAQQLAWSTTAFPEHEAAAGGAEARARAHHARRRRAGRRTSAGGGSLGGLGLTGEGCDADTPPAPCKKSTARATSAAGVSCAQYAAAGGSACGGALMRATRRALRGGAAAEEAPVPQRRRHSPGASALRAGGLRCAARTRCWSERAAQWVPTVPARVDVQRTTLGCTAAGTLDVEGVARPRTWQRVRHRAEQHAASQVT